MKFLVAIHRPNGYDPSIEEDETMGHEIDELNDDMVTAGIRVFVGGLQSTSTARSLRREADGAITISDGPYLDSKEHVGGFWVLDVKTLDDALSWGQRAAAACRASVEVRPFH